MTCHFSGNMDTESLNFLSEQSLQVASCILHLIENSLNPFSKMLEKPLKDGRSLLMLIDSLSCRDSITCSSRYLGLPISTNKSLVRQDVAALNELQYGFCCFPFVTMSRDERINQRDTLKAAHDD